MNNIKFEQNYFVDPVTKEPLLFDAMRVVMFNLNSTYKWKGTYWDLMPNRVDGDIYQWQIWDKLQSNGEVSYTEDPEHNLGVGNRQDFFDFQDFCGGFSGDVLDIGSGPQSLPTHFKNNLNHANYVGIDPLVGEQPKDYFYVRALAEYIPFVNDIFDEVLFVTSIDHILHIDKAIEEAKRVLKKGGTIYIWLTEKDADAPKPKVSHEWYDELKIPKGADDIFHVKRYTQLDLEQILFNNDLATLHKEVLDVDQYKRNVFYKLGV